MTKPTNSRIVRSRREFLRDLAWASAALATTGLHGQTKPPDRKLGIALLGLGGYASGELGPALRETKNCYLAGVVTGHPGKGERWAAEYGLNKKNIYNYENFDRIADNPDIDIVYVVTPPALHPEFTIRAAKAGKHVISEKPMATSVADCDRMISACKAVKVKLAIGYRLHFDLYHRELMRHAHEQDFGPAFSYSGIACQTSRGPLNLASINQQAAHMDDFADCIRSNRDTSVPGELGRRDMQIITAIYEAARTGKRVQVKS